MRIKIALMVVLFLNAPFSFGAEAPQPDKDLQILQLRKGLAETQQQLLMRQYQDVMKEIQDVTRELNDRQKFEVEKAKEKK